MPPTIPQNEPSTLQLNDIYHVLFRRKFGILATSLVGLLAGGWLCWTRPPPFQSEAKLFIRYVAEAKAPGPAGTATAAKSPDQRGETILDSEMEIITSSDLARQVALAIGPSEILNRPAGDADLNRAANVIKANLVVNSPPRSSVIRLVFSHPNPEVAQRVLREIIDRYLRVHLEIHSAVGIVGNFLNQETDQLRLRLAKTDADLRKLSNQAGVLSLEETKKAYSDQLALTRQQIFAAEAELAEHRAVASELEKRFPIPAAAARAQAASNPAVPPERLQEYGDAGYRINLLRRQEQDLLTQFRGENLRVKAVREQIAGTEQIRRQLETEFPQLAAGAAPAALTGDALPVDGKRAGPEDALGAESIRIAALESKVRTLNRQLSLLASEAERIDGVEGSILDLRRTKEMEEANYRYYASSLEQARIDEALGAGRVSNISEIQTPSPPRADGSTAVKLLAILGCGGIAIGLAWAFFAELYLDRTVKRPIDVERLLHPSLMLAVPSLAPEAKGGNGLALATALAPFHETLRDRLIGYFESKGLHRKPKMIGVSGIGSGAGVSTTASGLARSLSETGEGNVLLVDLTLGQESARHFVSGENSCDLDQVLEACDAGKVDANLFVAGDNPNCTQLSRNLPQRFSRLAPKLKASAFDYIIFDLPSVNPISITPRLAGFMDMLLLVVKSEETEQDVLRRAVNLLAPSQVSLGVVLNQTRSYIPARLRREMAFDS